MTYVRPFEPFLGGGAFVHGSLLVVAPHPDDEVIGCGGLICAHRDRGEAVHVLVMTDGAMGDRGVDRGEEYRERRRAETREAASRVGGFEATFLTYPDGALIKHPEASEDVRRFIDRTKPATVVFPSPFEVHPDHRAASLAVIAAISGLAAPPRLYAYEVGAMMPANVLLDVTPFMARKEAAITAYHSQLEHQDIIGKLRAFNRARTVNVDDQSFMYAEAYARVDPFRIREYADLAESLIRCVDSMGP